MVRRPDAGLLSRFPIGLFRKYRKASLSREIVVYPLPEVTPIPPVPPEDSRGGRSHPRQRGGGPDIRTLREFTPGDDLRDLHWKQSARMRRWIVREREAERDRVVVLAVDNALSDPTDSGQLADLEGRIARCAGQALVLLARGGEVGLQARGVKVAARGGKPQRTRILDALARLPAVPATHAPAFPPVRRGDLRRIVT